jgi:RNA polymerase sigma factor (sigma-70 family)
MRSLVDEAQRREKFRVLYEAAYPRVLGYALRRAPTPEDAADLVAETFLTAWRRFEELPPGDEAQLWLYGVAHRQLANQRRSELRRSALSERLARELEALAPVWHDPLPSDLTPFAAAWERLRPEDREVLGLVVWEGLSNAELAQTMNWSRARAKLRVHRARRRLAMELVRQGVEVDVAPAVSSALVAAAADVLAPRTDTGASLPAEVTPAVAPALQPAAAAGHVLYGRVPARPGRERS